MRDVIEVSLTPKDKELIAKIIAEQQCVDTPEQALLWALRTPYGMWESLIQVYQRVLKDLNLDGAIVVQVAANPEQAKAAVASAQSYNALIYDQPPIEPSTHTEMDRPKETSETTEDKNAPKTTQK